MSAMEDWTNEQLLMLNGNQLLSVTSEDAEDLVGVCIPKAMRGVVTAHNNGVSKYCQCDDVDIDVIATVETQRGTAFDATQTAILAAIQEDFGATTNTEAIRRCISLIGELLYINLMP